MALLSLFLHGSFLFSCFFSLKLLVFQYSTLISFRFFVPRKVTFFSAFSWPDPPAAWGLPNLKGLLQIQVGDSIPQLESDEPRRGWFGGTKKSKESNKPNKPNKCDVHDFFSRFSPSYFKDKKTKPKTKLSNQSGCMWRPIKYSADR